MPNWRPFLKKKLIRGLGAPVLETIRFRMDQLAHLRGNLRFRKNNPGLAIPPAPWLFETYRTDYQSYFEDGLLAAKEICNWTEPYLGENMPLILDWGTGTGRIIRHMHTCIPNSLLYGADPNTVMIEWNTAHIGDVLFSTLKASPPTDYPPDFFDLIYGISVLTHLNESSIKAWISELHRILKPGGILLLTTHGNAFSQQLDKQERNQLEANGILFYSARSATTTDGQRKDTCYISHSYFDQLIAPNFSVTQYFDGASHPEKFGGQDLWILQKK